MLEDGVPIIISLVFMQRFDNSNSDFCYKINLKVFVNSNKEEGTAEPLEGGGTAIKGTAIKRL